MQIVSIGDNLHEMTNLFSGEKNINSSSADLDQKVVTVKDEEFCMLGSVLGKILRMRHIGIFFSYFKQ